MAPGAFPPPPGRRESARAAHTHRNKQNPAAPGAAIGPHPGLATSSEEEPNFAPRAAAYLRSAGPSETIPGGRAESEEPGSGGAGGRAVGEALACFPPPLLRRAGARGRAGAARPARVGEGGGARPGRAGAGWGGLGGRGGTGPRRARSPSAPGSWGVREGASPRAGARQEQQEPAEGAGPRPGFATSCCLLVFLWGGWEGSETHTVTELVSL